MMALEKLRKIHEPTNPTFQPPMPPFLPSGHGLKRPAPLQEHDNMKRFRPQVSEMRSF
jgi:hypothetical protein